MTADELQKWIAFASELPLHGLLLIAVVVLWFDNRKTRKQLEDCLTNNTLNAQRMDLHEQAIDQLIEDVLK